MLMLNATEATRPTSAFAIDRAALRSAAATLATEVRSLKKELRQSGHNITRIEAATLSAKKARLTLLYAITAQCRGRLHLRRCVRRHAALGLRPMEKVTMQDQAEWIGQQYLEFAAL